jgi:hypothetical protein
MNMVSADLLDRRALALIRLVDVHGRPVPGPVRIEGDGVVTARKDGGFAVLEAAGLKAHASAFLAPPATPPVQSRHVLLDLTPAAAGVMPRRFDLRLPRDPAPANADSATSLFQPVEIEMPPSPRAPAFGSACLLHVSVRRKSDGKVIEHALVRARSDDKQFAARGLTDARGEATLVFPTLPLAFPGGAANVQPELPARVVVTVDGDVALFHGEDEMASAVQAAAVRTTDHPDPDALAAADADFASGTPVNLAALRQPSLVIEWKKP